MAKKKKSHVVTKWDFGINLTNKCYNLIRSGYIYALLAFLVFSIFPILALRMPEDELPKFADNILKFMASCGAGYLAMGTLIAYLLYIIRRQKVSFKKNLNQGCKEREELIHTKNPKKLGIHMSSRLIQEAGIDEDQPTDGES